MKKLLLLLTLLPLTIFAQTEQQGSESVSEWTSIQYVDLDNDIINKSFELMILELFFSIKQT